MGVPTSAFNPLFVGMLRVYGFALPRIKLQCNKGDPLPEPPPKTRALDMQTCCAGFGEPGLFTWNHARGFVLWYVVCLGAYGVDVLLTGERGIQRHTGMLTALAFWPLIYFGATLQLTLLGRYSKALALMGEVGVSDRCCEPQCCQEGGCLGFCSVCGCPCGKPPGVPGERAPLLLPQRAEGASRRGRGKAERERGAGGGAPRMSPVLRAKAGDLLRYLRYRWTLGLGVLAYIAVAACAIGVNVNFIVQVIDVVWWGNADGGVKLAVLTMGFLSSLNFGMLGPTIAAWVGSLWALMFCHELQCWDWECAMAGYQEGVTELHLWAESEVEDTGTPSSPPDDAIALAVTSESEARFVDCAIAKYTALRKDLEASHARVKMPLYAFLAILAVLFLLGLRDFFFANASPHLGQQNNIISCPFIALFALAPLINLSTTLDNVAKTLTHKSFDWGGLSVNSRVFIGMHIDKHPLFYDQFISAFGARGARCLMCCSCTLPSPPSHSPLHACTAAPPCRHEDRGWPRQHACGGIVFGSVPSDLSQGCKAVSYCSIAA